MKPLPSWKSIKAMCAMVKHFGPREATPRGLMLDKPHPVGFGGATGTATCSSPRENRHLMFLALNRGYLGTRKALAPTPTEPTP